jgi:hypothetical protein
VGGFGEPSNEELVHRWMQVGAFQPFFRNHNAYVGRSVCEHRADFLQKHPSGAVSLARRHRCLDSGVAYSISAVALLGEPVRFRSSTRQVSLAGL